MLMEDLVSFAFGGVYLLIILLFLFNFLISMKVYQVSRRLATIEGSLNASTEELRFIRGRMQRLKLRGKDTKEE
jgi:hypothetical protein